MIEERQTGPQAAGPWLAFLERATAVVLALVLLSIGWIVLMAFAPHAARLSSPDLEVGVLLVLLLAALVLVSSVALLHTRPKERKMGDP